jgi:hypothetical protein
VLGKSERDRGRGKEKASAENQGNDDTHAATEEGGGGRAGGTPRLSDSRVLSEQAVGSRQ